MRPLHSLLRELGVGRSSETVVSRGLGGGRSASLPVAREHARQFSESPVYWAKTKRLSEVDGHELPGIDMLVSREEAQMLAADGAEVVGDL